MKSKQLRYYLNRSIQEKFALPAFNTLNMEFTQILVKAAIEAKAPIIIQITESSVSYAGFDYIESIFNVANQCPHIFIHLDHGMSNDTILKCLRSDAFSSVMIDRSKAPLDQNIKESALIKQQAGDKLVEAELGIVGGKEEDIIAEGSIYTKVDEAVHFVDATKIDLFAPAVGTAHGVYKETPVLNYQLIADLRHNLSVPLVLHGSSGLSDEQLKRSIEAGMNKINIDTELKQNFIDGFMGYMNSHPDAYDLRKIFGASKEQLEAIALEKIKLCGADGKA